jgi:chromosome transmission fidelity protein 8
MTEDSTDNAHWKGKPTLMIGHHLLEGKIANLPKPVAVLQKVASSVGVKSAGEIAGESNIDARVPLLDGDAGSPSWDMVAVVKRKIVFAKRPTPIVGIKPESNIAPSS